MEDSLGLFSWMLVVAGFIGAGVAIVHGILMQRLMIKPILDQVDATPATMRLLPILLQFSTFCWFFGGVVLIATPIMPNSESIITAAVFVGGFYLFGSIGNFIGTKGRHPGWVLLAISSALIAISLFGISAG